MSQDSSHAHPPHPPAPAAIDTSYYSILGVHPTASSPAIRRAYRDLSKRYHPDTTLLVAEVATAKFQQLNEAYGVLSNPDRRLMYDLQIGISRWNVIQTPADLDLPPGSPSSPNFSGSKSAYLDPHDRPLSAGEIFALSLLGATMVGCLGLAVLVAWLRGDPLIVP